MFNTGLAKKIGVHEHIDKARKWIQNLTAKFIIPKKKKIFCIGKNKTGTTSIAVALEEYGFILGNQRKAELLNDAYFEKDFEKIVDYCKSAEAFQDVPFSWPETYKYMDKAFPGSKFILTVRDNPEKWYNSVINFQSKIWGQGKLPTVEQLKNVSYVYKGWAWSNRVRLLGITEKDDPYDKNRLIEDYKKHNKDVISYFKNRENDLLVLNVSEKDAYIKFCQFINKKPKGETFPWANKTSEIK